MNSELYWFNVRTFALDYLLTNLRKAKLNPVPEQEADWAQCWVNLALPSGNVLTSIMIQGTTLRFTAHSAISGAPTDQSFANLNQVNLHPWAGRAYASPDGNGVDISFGVPLPIVPDPHLPLPFYIFLIGNAVSQLRSGALPDYSGPKVPSTQLVINEHVQWAVTSGVKFDELHNQQLLVMDTYSNAGHEIRLELFTTEGELSAARVHAETVIAKVQAPYHVLSQVNQVAPAGALAWDEHTQRLSATTVLYPAVFSFSQRDIAWAVDHAIALFDQGVASLRAQ